MQQTGLNLIAIGIFTITLSVLLGPLLHIPPAIPAVTTLAILGLATIDTLGLDSRGVNLLVDFFASGEERDRIVYHEAGHFLAAYFLGIPVKDYTLTAWETFKAGYPGKGGVIFNTEILNKTSFDYQETPLIVERFSTVWMAGIAAENIIYGEAIGGGEDKQKIRQLLHLTGAGNQNYQQKEKWAFLQAKNLIQKYENGYKALVEAMKNRLSVEECYQLLQKHCAVDTSSSQDN